MEYFQHHEMQFKELHVKVCIPKDETQTKKQELKTRIAQTRKDFLQDTVHGTVV